MTMHSAKRKHAAREGRDSETRDRLLAAAIEVFGRLGYDAASTRALAAEAGVNLAAIPYHFGGKEGLYTAVAEAIVERAGAVLHPFLAQAEAAAAGPGLNREELGAQLAALLRGVAGFIAGSPEARRYARIVLREHIAPTPTPAFDILYEGVFRRLHQACGALLARILDEPEGGTANILRAHAVLGQVLAFRVGENALLRRLGQERLEPADLDLLGSIVSDHVRALVAHAPGPNS